MADDSSLTKTKQAGIGENVKIQQLFKLMVESGGSDLHLTVGSPPGLRVNGEIVRVKIPSLTAADTKRLIYQVLSEEQKNEFEKNLELDEVRGSDMINIGKDDLKGWGIRNFGHRHTLYQHIQDLVFENEVEVVGEDDETPFI